MKKITITTLESKKHNHEKFSCVTAYDASFAKLVAQAEIETLLVGDSLGNVIQGESTTVPVTIEHMAYHMSCVVAGLKTESFQPLLIADMPYMSYVTPEQCIENATYLMQSGAQMVKLEGADWVLDSVHFLSERGLNVCGHLGLTPQTVDSLGGFRVQGTSEQQAQEILEQSHALADAGARLLVLECVPTSLAKMITEQIKIPVIGIGAGPDTDSQVLVIYDLLGITSGRKPRFVKDFLSTQDGGVLEALRAYKSAVISSEFPEAEHCFE